MSGTSCDGIDVALVRIKGTGPKMLVKLVAFRTIEYAPDLKLRLLAPHIDARESCALNFELGDRFADAAAGMIETAKDEGIAVDFIACSGHTLVHMPPRDNQHRGTFQIGEAAVIAERVRLPVVADFRTRDIAAGGQGAPLVPYADWIMFNRKDRTVACLNIGGIANVTVVPPRIDDVFAFDTGPGNMAIDGAVRLLTSGTRQMDTDGKNAAQGVVIDEFLDYLLDHPYFIKNPPKSTGREEFGPETYLRDALASRREHSFEDLVATVTTAVAYSIIRAYNRFIKPNYEVSRLVVSGGGAHNKTLIERIRQGLPNLTIRMSDDYGMPVDSREAVAFAMLGNETLCNTAANIPHATGASHKVVLGRITPP
jgi:anhydro-N-acetylmuramic acid kinase